MENKLFLSSDDFEGSRLNKSFFTNINKGVSEEALNAAYPTDKYDHFEKGIIESFIKDTYAATGGEIVKGGFNDTEDVSKVLENMKSQVSLLKGIIVEGQDGEVKEIFVMPKQEVTIVSETDKAIDTLEKGKDSDQLEKGKIEDALYYGDVKITFSKTGKQIKEKLAAIKNAENLKLEDLKKSLDDMEDTLCYKPTEKPYNEKDDIFYKTFKWDMTYPQDSCNNNVIQFNETQSGSLTVEDCDLNRKWNDCVYSYRDTKREIDAINLLEENLEDGKKYELNARQMLNFGF